MNDVAEQLQSWITWLKTHPPVLLLLIAVPFVLLAWAKQIYPRLRLVLLLITPCVASLIVFWQPSFLPGVIVADIAIIVLAIVDFQTVPMHRDFAVQRNCQGIASLRKPHSVSISISNVGSRHHHLEIRDGVPTDFDAQPFQFEASLPARSRTALKYEFRAARRGAFEIDAVYCRVQSRLGLWCRHLSYPHVTTIKVYPDLKQLSEYALLARTNRLNLMGVRRTRRIGQDNEFERLRDYTLDDNYRHIDWRSTARRNKLTVKDFQTNQSQRVVFMLDCGRMMTNVAAGNSLLDHSLNAMLMLSYVALSQGDSVGLVTFSDRIHSSVPLRSGRNQMNHLLHAVYDRFPQLVESRYEEAFLHLSARCRKRSLVVLITNIIDDVNARQIQRYLSLFSKRHLPLAVVLRDHQLYDAVNPPSDTNASVFRRAAAAEVLSWRHQALTDLGHQGVLVLDTFPESMTAPLINRYLEAKARQRL